MTANALPYSCRRRRSADQDQPRPLPHGERASCDPGDRRGGDVCCARKGPVRSHRSRYHDAGRGWPLGLPASARDEQNSHRPADGQVGRDRPDRRSGTRRGRLRLQAFQSARTPGPHPRHIAARRARARGTRRPRHPWPSRVGSSTGSGEHCATRKGLSSSLRPANMTCFWLLPSIRSMS